jgi:hydroxymethylbilane synthase
MSANASPTRLVIATRESPLALYQANHVSQLLRRLYPSASVELLGMTTKGDRILDRSLAAVGGKGLFIKELEQALEERRADLAVHSLKDVPMDLPDGFALPAILVREDPHDAFVSNNYAAIDALPPGARVGTSSLRREAALHAAYPRLSILPLRGNVGTRLKKLDEGQYDAIILAVAGLKRLELASRIRMVLPPEQSLPAVGQGALAIETLATRDDLRGWLAPLHDADTSDCTRAERAFSRGLSGSCHTPLAAHALIDRGQIWLRGFLASTDGSTVLRGEARGARDDPESIGRSLAADFHARGAAKILDVAGVE